MVIFKTYLDFVPRRRWEDNIKMDLQSGMWGYGLDRVGSI